jgi:hypothetical protein
LEGVEADDGVELAVLVGQEPQVSDAHVRARHAPAGVLDEGRRGVERRHVRPTVGGHPQVGARSATDLEDGHARPRVHQIEDRLVYRAHVVLVDLGPVVGARAPELALHLRRSRLRR